MTRQCLIAGLAACLYGQEQLKFEVASLRVRPPNALITAVGGSPSGPRVTLEAMSLSNLISWAWDVKPWQVAGGPAWAGVQKDATVLESGTRRFDIAAKAEGEGARPIGELHAMMRSLLAERFQLAVHTEMRETRVYAMTIDKGGSRLGAGSPDGPGVIRMNGGGRITATGATIPQLINWFSNANGVDRPVIDRTGLTQHYDFALEWSIPRTARIDSAPDIFTAMPEQLGLRLVPQNAPIEYLVIDHAEMPTAN